MTKPGHRLDPSDWDAFETQMHDLLQACITRMKNARDLPWTPVPDGFDAAVSLDGRGYGVEATFNTMVSQIMPQATGNTHPRFFGWVHGTGLPVSVGAEMVAATMNANTGGRAQGATDVEHAVIKWLCGIAGMSDDAFGILTGGTSQATILALSAARIRAFGTKFRQTGLRDLPPLRVYIAQGGHSCISKALEIMGHGRDALCEVPLGPDYKMDTSALCAAIAEDRAAGIVPLAIVGTAGSVGIGAYDDLTKLADIARDQGLWLHVDAAFGFWIQLAGDPWSTLANGIGEADSIALDLHKWIGVPYACGACLIADSDLHRQSFATRPDYLTQATEGLAGGDLWFCDYGMDLSRGFHALKVWAAVHALGQEAFGAVIADNCHQAAQMAELITQSPGLELAAPVVSNICCFRAPGHDPAQISAQLQIEGRTVLSTTKVDGVPCLRAAIVNHRTTPDDVAATINAVLDVITHTGVAQKP